MLSYFVGNIKAYEEIWIVGDDFMADTVGQYLQSDNQEGKPYMRERYETRIFPNTSLYAVKSITTKLHNNLVPAIREQKLLPKAVIFVIDDDLIKNVNYDHMGISEIFGQLLKDLMSGINRMISSYKENLPNKAKRYNYPTILWVEVPIHKNMPEHWKILRKKFSSCQESCAKFFPGMNTLYLKKVWDQNESEFFSDRRFTAKGLTAYWMSIDSAFWHWDTFIYPKSLKDDPAKKQK